MSSAPASVGLDTAAAPPHGRTSLHAALIALAALGLGVSAATLGHTDYWLDEVLTVRALSGGYLDMVANRIQGGHQPLYFSLAWAWSQVFGLGEAALRSLSWVILVGITVLAGVIGRMTLGRTAGLFAAALAALSPQLIYFSHLVRPYVLMALLALVAVLMVLRYERKPGAGRAAWVGAATLLLLLTHYATLFAAAPLLAFLLWRWRTMWRAALAQGVALLVWLPWGLWCKSHYTLDERLHWLPPADWRTLLVGVANLAFDGPSWGKLLSVSPLALGAWAVVSVGVVAVCVRGMARMGRDGVLLGVVWAGPLVVGVVWLFAFDRDLFPSVRYFAPMIGVAPVLVAAGLTPPESPASPERLRWLRAGHVLAAGFLLLAAAGTVKEIAAPKNAVSWRQIAAHLAEHAAATDPVLAIEYPEAAAAAFYTGRPVDVLEPTPIGRPRAWYDAVHVTVPEAVIASGAARVWVVLSPDQMRAYEAGRLSERDAGSLAAVRAALPSAEIVPLDAGGVLVLSR